MSEPNETANGNGTPPRIPDWGQWLANEMRQGFAALDRRIDDVIKEPNRRLDVMESEIKSLDKAVDTEREERRALQGSIGTWKWIAGIVGLPGIIGLLVALANAANLRVTGS